MGLGRVNTGQSSSEENPVLQQAVIPHSAARGHDTQCQSKLLGASHTPSFVLTFTFTAPWSLSSQMSTFPRLPWASLPSSSACQTSFHSGLSPPAIPLLCSFTQALLLFSSTWGAQHQKAGIPTGAELKSYYIPCSLLLGEMCARVCLFLVHWTSRFFAFRPTLGMWDAAWPSVTQCSDSILASQSLNVGSSTQQWLF